MLSAGCGEDIRRLARRRELARRSGAGRKVHRGNAPAIPRRLRRGRSPRHRRRVVDRRAVAKEVELPAPPGWQGGRGETVHLLGFGAPRRCTSLGLAHRDGAPPWFGAARRPVSPFASSFVGCGTHPTSFVRLTNLSTSQPDIYFRIFPSLSDFGRMSANDGS